MKYRDVAIFLNNTFPRKRTLDVCRYLLRERRDVLPRLYNFRSCVSAISRSELNVSDNRVADYCGVTSRLTVVTDMSSRDRRE